jgi:hypothetical protein
MKQLMARCMQLTVTFARLAHKHTQNTVSRHNPDMHILYQHLKRKRKVKNHADQIRSDQTGGYDAMLCCSTLQTKKLYGSVLNKRYDMLPTAARQLCSLATAALAPLVD